jgi:hypothetical protein
MEAWPLFGLELRCRGAVLRPVREADLPHLAAIVPDDHEHNPRAERFGWQSEREHHERVLVYQQYWRTMGTWSPSSWDLAFAVQHDGELVGVQSLEAEHFPDLRTVDSGSWLVPEVRGRGQPGLARRVPAHRVPAERGEPDQHAHRGGRADPPPAHGRAMAGVRAGRGGHSARLGRLRAVVRGGVTRIVIDHPGAIVVRPDGDIHTGVLVLAGSSGRVDRDRALLLARHGVLAASTRWRGAAIPGPTQRWARWCGPRWCGPSGSAKPRPNRNRPVKNRPVKNRPAWNRPVRHRWRRRTPQ